MANDAECGYVVIGAVTSMEDIKARKEQTKTEAGHGRVESRVDRATFAEFYKSSTVDMVWL